MFSARPSSRTPLPSKRNRSSLTGTGTSGPHHPHTLSASLTSRSALFATSRVEEWRHVTTQIWIESVKGPNGRGHYTADRGLLLIARLGGPDGRILVEG